MIDVIIPVFIVFIIIALLNVILQLLFLVIVNNQIIMIIVTWTVLLLVFTSTTHTKEPQLRASSQLHGLCANETSSTTREEYHCNACTVKRLDPFFLFSATIGQEKSR